MKKQLLFLSFCIMSLNMMAQKIYGVVKDETGNPVKGTTISLLKAKDSTIAKFTSTKADGQYQFEGMGSGSYVVKTSFVGYKTVYSTLIVLSEADVTMTALKMVKNTTNLNEVVVTSKKPLVEIKADKTILNVENSINSVGSDALELLRKSPGVTVDRDDNLAMDGKSGVQVYIDGRPTPLAGRDLAEYLKSLQSSNIEAIELITNPSAKYEAAGNAGIINIRLKKNKSYGTNGSVNGGWAIGTYAKYNGGISLNNRNSKTNIFGMFNYNDNKNLNTMQFYRTVADTSFSQKNEMITYNTNSTYKAGLDYYINKKSTLGFIVNGTAGNSQLYSNSNTNISYIPTDSLVKILTANNTNDMKRSNVNANINYRFVDTSGRELNLDGNYAYYYNYSNQYQPNVYYDKTGINEISSVEYNMIAPSNINLYSLKADYEQNFKKGKLGLGGKISFVNSDNDFQRYNIISDVKQLDTLRSNRFVYNENINALYVNYNRSFKGLIVQAGLRSEYTILSGTSTGQQIENGFYVPYDSTFKRDYLDFFPSVAVTFNKNPKNQWGLSYSRRIDRPAYQDLNPFEFKLDEYTYMKGNTFLRPQYTNSFGISNTYKFKLNTRLSYSHVEDMFAQLLDTTETSKSFRSKQNLATQDIISLNISYPFSYKNFNSFISGTANYSVYQADFGPGRTVDLDVFSYNFYMQNSLKIRKTWTVELTGFYTSPSIWQGTFQSIGMGGIDIGMQKTILKGKANIKATLTDVFNTMRWSGTSDFAGQYVKASGKWESQQFRMNFSYRFGRSQIKAARQRSSSIEEENKRTQSSGGGMGGQ